MVVLLKKNPDKEQVDNLIAWLKGMDITVHMSEGTTQTIMGLIGDTVRLPLVPGSEHLRERFKTLIAKYDLR